MILNKVIWNVYVASGGKMSSLQVEIDAQHAHVTITH